MSVATFPRTRQLFVLFLLLLFGQFIAGVLIMVSGALLGNSEEPAQWLYPLIGVISMAPAIRYTWRRSGRPVFRYDWSILRSRRMVAGLLFAFALIGFGSGLLIGYLPTADAIPEVGDDRVHFTLSRLGPTLGQKRDDQGRVFSDCRRALAGA
jgi:membrane protease YdiL (CAAX protease family)